MNQLDSLHKESSDSLLYALVDSWAALQPQNNAQSMEKMTSIHYIQHSLHGNAYLTQAVLQQLTPLAETCIHTQEYAVSQARILISKMQTIEANDLENCQYAEPILSDFGDKGSSRSIRVYPNPAKDLLYMEWDINLAQPIMAEISDLTGKTLTTHILNPKSTIKTVQTSALPAGVYILKIYHSDHSMNSLRICIN